MAAFAPSARSQSITTSSATRAGWSRRPSLTDDVDAEVHRDRQVVVWHHAHRDGALRHAEVVIVRRMPKRQKPSGPVIGRDVDNRPLGKGKRIVDSPPERLVRLCHINGEPAPALFNSVDDPVRPAVAGRMGYGNPLLLVKALFDE